MAPKARTAAFTDEQIEIGLLLLISTAYPDAVGPDDGSEDAAIDEALAPLVGRHGFDEERIAPARAGALAARRAIENGSCPEVSAARIDAARADLLERWGASSSRGALVWPPASRTVAVRLGAGSWADALASRSIPVSRLGRARGSGRFGPERIASAVNEYLEHARARSHPATLGGYDRWVRQARAGGRTDLPSTATVRQRCGTWDGALALASDPR
ncbi:hypothetical protein M3T53_00950 [Actinomyces sp. B33]|uniref:hypothetical protein n=1 Tax=Actinomyces sp. B33 TaxID=2942131 RepID=UPI0023408305|nr:hypothetical protein [Actinomyces sp. B33]MDC4232285.1 hypothetical protein [Actinomyces sp. B33]